MVTSSNANSKNGSLGPEQVYAGFPPSSQDVFDVDDVDSRDGADRSAILFGFMAVSLSALLVGIAVGFALCSIFH